MTYAPDEEDPTQNPQPPPYVPDPQPDPPPPEEKKGRIVGAKTGFDYSDRWDVWEGGSRSWQLGWRPPDRGDWWDMTPAQRKAIGLETDEEWMEAAQAWKNSDEGRRQQGLATGGASGGSSFTGGAKAPAAARTGFDPGGDEFTKKFQAELEKLMQSGGSLTPDIIAKMKAAARVRAENQREIETVNVQSRLARSGLGNSPAGQKMLADADRRAQQMYSADATQIEVTAHIQNFKDKIDALDRSERFINDRMQYELGREGNEIARANLALGYRKLAQDKELAYAGFANQLKLLTTNLDWQSNMWDKQLPLDFLKWLAGQA